jgi:hypothetical protein
MKRYATEAILARTTEVTVQEIMRTHPCGRAETAAGNRRSRGTLVEQFTVRDAVHIHAIARLDALANISTILALNEIKTPLAILAVKEVVAD